MAVESAQDRASFVADFGESATFKGSSITVLIQAKHDLSSGFELNGSELQTTDYIIEAPSTSFPNVVQGDSVVIGSATYVVIAVMPDGMGWTELLTEKV